MFLVGWGGRTGSGGIAFDFVCGNSGGWGDDSVDGVGPVVVSGVMMMVVMVWEVLVVVVVEIGGEGCYCLWWWY